MTDTQAAASTANRIAGYDPAVDPSELLAHPLNARVHPESQREALGESLSKVGWTDVVKVSKRTGTIVDGHARVEEAVARGESVPVLWLDLDEDEERFVLATHDPIGALAGYNPEVLRELMDGIEVESDALSAWLDAAVQLDDPISPDPEPPESFDPIGDVETDHECPKCGYQWS